MMTPTIHNNGTSVKALNVEATTAYFAVLDAIDALVKMTINGRDYYPQGPGALETASKEHADRPDATSLRCK